MKLRSSLLVPCLIASLLLPAAGHLSADQKAEAASQLSFERSEHPGHPVKENHKKLEKVIDQNASPSLKKELKKNLAAHEKLMKEWRKTSGFKKHKEQWSVRRKAFYKANKEKIEAIKNQVKTGKLTKQQAHEQIAALFETQHKGKFHGRHCIYKELKTAVHNKDKAAIQSALEKLDKHLKTSNQELKKKISEEQ